MGEYTNYPRRRIVDEDGKDAMGEVQTTPTSNTLLRRLKDLLTGTILAAGANVIGKVRLVTTAGHEVTDDTADAVKTIISGSGTATMGKVRIVTALGDELSDDTLDAIKTVEKEDLVYYAHTATSGTLGITAKPGVAFRLQRIELHLGSTPTKTEAFTVTMDAGDGSEYDILLYTNDLAVGGTTNLVLPYGDCYEYEADDEIDVAWPNSGTQTYGVRIACKKLI